jgi:hypothetical protein
MSGVFFAGCNIPVACFLMWYGLDPDPPEVATKLRSYEKYVSIAGLTLFVTAVVGMGAAFAAIQPRSKSEEASQETEPESPEADAKEPEAIEHEVADPDD